MKQFYFLLVLLTFSFKGLTQTKTIHVFVALCDNQYQGIVPVPEKLGNGQSPKSNLYWGAAYGVKSFFKYKTKDWALVKQEFNTNNNKILERIVFKHKSKDVYLLADAYDGKCIKTCTEDFLRASNGQKNEDVKVGDKLLSFGGASNLVGYIGHDGLMDFNVAINYQETSLEKEVVILACYSRDFFSDEIIKAGAKPLLWTTHLMAPEAYTLKAAIDGWLNTETKSQIKERAAQAYNKYQKCGIRGARNLFAIDFKKK